jgi:hypothetical protein
MSLHKLLETSELISQGAEAVRSFLEKCLDFTQSTMAPIESLQSLLDLTVLTTSSPQIPVSQEISASIALGSAHTDKDHIRG